MKILLSGALNPAFEALPEYLASAFRRLGHEVWIFDHRAFLIPGRLRSRLPFLDHLDREGLNARFLRRARALRPSLVLINQGVVLAPRTIEATRALGARCVNWFSDYPSEFDEGMRAAPLYDAFFLASSYAAERHLEAGHHRAGWLPFGFDPAVHRPLDSNRPGDFDPGRDRVVFVGSHYPERQVLLRFLRGLPVGIWGPGWERARRDPDLAPMIRGGALRPSAWRGLYGQAEVALNIHYGSFGPREVSGDLANTRLFEILGCGAYQVVDRQGDVLRLFQDGQDLDGFSCGDELRSIVERALADADRPRRIASRGRASALSAHTYEHRARMLIDPEARGLGLAQPPEGRSPAAHAAADGTGLRRAPGGPAR